MRLRAAHFACLVFLLSSLGVAEASVLRSGALADVYIVSLLHQATAQHQEDRPTAATSRARYAEALAPAPFAGIEQPGIGHTAAFQAAQVHTHTGLRR